MSTQSQPNKKSQSQKDAEAAAFGLGVIAGVTGVASDIAKMSASTEPPKTGQVIGFLAKLALAVGSVIALGEAMDDD